MLEDRGEITGMNQVQTAHLGRTKEEHNQNLTQYY